MSNSLEQLTIMGYVVTFSEACSIKAWGNWHLGVAKDNGPQVHGYGDTEEQAADAALKTVQILG